MKKALIIFAILFVLTLAIPAIAAFIKTPAENTNELATLFSGSVLMISHPLSFQFTLISSCASERTLPQSSLKAS